MKIRIIVFIFFSLPFSLFAQLNIQGYVLTAGDSSAVPFAHVTLKNKPIGTCTNENGYFQFKLDSVYLNDTLVISGIGYNNYTFTGAGVSLSDSLFYLEEARYELKAAVIINNAPTADEIIKRVIRNYGKNYSRTGYQASAFFQDIVYNYAVNAPREVARITEAAITLQEYGVHTSRDVKFRVDEMRNSQNFIETDYKMEWLKKVLFDGLKNPIIEMYNKYNINRKSYFKSFLEEHSAELERIEYLDTNAVFVLKFDKIKKNSGFIYSHRLYINTKDYAILKEDFKVDFEPSFQEILGVKESLGFRKIKLYHKIEQNYYPFLIEYFSGIRDQGYTPNKSHKYFRHSFIMINEVIPKRRDYNRIKWREKEKENDILYNQKYTYNQAFWDHFNVLYTQEEVSKAMQLMSKEKDIKKQFIENSK
ncbi:MAG TPA: carboxypeptidase-like regulatory domain-containing protein [Bacteroidales bacterium]|nr:carboxypeptidase-like regulatory domain-containing protein [Bacteroidales bacterium]